MEYVIETNKLCKDYGKKHKILKDLDIHVPKGSIYGLVGKNGAGKTTFMRVVCGIQKQTSGTISLFGINNDDNKIKNAHRKMGAIIETPSLCLELSARDNLKQQYRYLGLPSFDGIDELLELVGLSDTGKKYVKNFSLGMKQRMGLAMVLAGNPDFIVLDEPMNGLDPAGIIEMRELILKLNRDKDITFLISSHILDELSKVATHYGFIDSGKLVDELAASDIEKRIRKSVTIETSDIKSMTKYLETKGYEYVVEEEKKIVVFADIELNEIMPDLVSQNISIKSFYSTNETLESYYLNLIGGSKHE